jgi:putative ABC transport system ATP-binding protein
MDRTSTDAVIELRDVTKEYAAGARTFTALHALTFTVHRGECVAMVGPSGSGKTTLVNLLTGIDSPTSGELSVLGTRIDQLSQDDLATWRGRHIGLVFQFFQLLPTLTVAENVMLPMEFAGAIARRDQRARALALLDQLRIVEQADKLPSDLSGGQQQRAAIARALANDPPLLIADEPTGNLDSDTSDAVLSLLASLAASGKTVLTVTHERAYASYFNRSIVLRDGHLVPEQTPTPIQASV